MKLTELLFSKAKETWDQATEKPFVIAMAKGTLSDDLYKRYQLQDYLYLQEYIGILNRIKEFSDSDEITGFLDAIINEVIEELDHVHLPYLRKLGIKDEEIVANSELPVIREYIGYMKGKVEEYGLIAGITALLQCSWGYAYIGRTMFEKHAEEISGSKYKMWFEAYTSEGYVSANNTWIEVLDKLGADISEEETKTMTGIFTRCAQYEDELWDALYQT